MTTVCQAAMTDNFEDMENLILGVCYRFAATYGGDVKEMIDLCNFNFVQAFQGGGYNPKMAALSTWTHTITWRKLHQERRKAARRRKIVPLEDSREMEKVGYFDRMAWQEEFSENAKRVIELAVHMPTTLRLDAERRGGEGIHKRECIREFLEGLDWTRDRITETFQEIVESLK